MNLHNLRKLFYALIVALNVIIPLYSQDLLSAPMHGTWINDDVKALLAGYLQNDITLQELAIKVKQAELGLGKTGIQTGVALELSTGQLWISGDDKGGVFKIAPNAKVAAPLLNNTSISLSADASGKSGETKMDNAGLSVSTAIITNNVKKSKLSLILAERALKTAKLDLQKRLLQSEKDFYTELSSIYEAAVSSFTLQDDAFTKEIELKVALVQGYGENSVRYRTVLLESLAKKRDAEQQMREFERKKAEFFTDCGIENGILPDIILQNTEAEKQNHETTGTILLNTVPSFSEQDSGNFSEIEAAQWAHYSGELTRKADGALELNFNGGFTLNNTLFDRNTSINSGLTMAFKGITATLGTEIPLSDDQKPALTLSIGLNLNTLRLNSINESEKLLNAESEMLAIQKAQKLWQTTSVNMAKTKEDLAWESKEKAEHAELYKILESDTTEYYKSGFVTESEYKNAQTASLKSAYQCLLSDIKIIQYVIDYRLYFTQ
ncbi:hypothetical protein FACS1894102_1350 [Spirochaetia bacterium]|nr:hypothetical protein FACS1894102_1350 [Spirochaetia bacterium]